MYLFLIVFKLCFSLLFCYSFLILILCYFASLFHFLIIQLMVLNILLMFFVSHICFPFCIFCVFVFFVYCLPFCIQLSLYYICSSLQTIATGWTPTCSKWIYHTTVIACLTMYTSVRQSLQFSWMARHVLATSVQPTAWTLVGCQGQPEISIRLSKSTWVIKDKVVRLDDIPNNKTDTHAGRVPITSTWVMAAINLSPHADKQSVNCTDSGVDSVSSMLQLQQVMVESLGFRTVTPKSRYFVPRRISLAWQTQHPAFEL